jgi:hypothetical protein
MAQQTPPAWRLPGKTSWIILVLLRLSAQRAWEKIQRGPHPTEYSDQLFARYSPKASQTPRNRAIVSGVKGFIDTNQALRSGIDLVLCFGTWRLGISELAGLAIPIF